ncbi:MAG: aspartate-semialdehyde dehydrogenase [Parachlamydiaceae bacterium]|nr:aspartate-semialdehyde dehydrogenase [Parachlamydiaceae bacterium]
MSGHRNLKEKIPVVILGATGCVGQKLVQLLTNHPWFSIAALCASERSIGKSYGEAVKWLMPTPLPRQYAQMIVQPCEPIDNCSLAFSGLDSLIAKKIETSFAHAGYLVVSNSSCHRMSPDTPLLIGEVNSDHLALVEKQTSKGKIITNPNCSVIGISLALKPLMDQFGLEMVHVVTMQAISGAGYPGVASLDIYDNVIPFIEGEESKVEKEPLKILGTLTPQGIQAADFKISAQCNRVGVTDGHMACVSVKFKVKPSPEKMIKAWRNFSSLPQKLKLPSAPFHPLYYFDEPHYPQPKIHRSMDKEMAVSIGRLRPCSIFDYKFCLLSHNTVRGAAGAALMNAELYLHNQIRSF